MNLPLDAGVSLLVLGAAGTGPVLALVGLRWWGLLLLPLGGSIVAALSATATLAIGGSLMQWFAGLASALLALAVWRWIRTARHRSPSQQALPRVSPWWTVVGALLVLGATAWCLRSLATPTIGFDTRAVWMLRAGWFLRPHQQLLATMRVGIHFLPQSTYPPLVSAAGAVAWSVTGQDSVRLGVLVIALLNGCALALGALAVLRAGLGAATVQGRRLGGRHWSGYLPAVVGLVGAVLLVFVTFGVTEPFMTNGYADPLWSLTMVGAIAYGLQLDAGEGCLGAAALLVLVAGMSKEEGAATAVLVIVLLVARRCTTLIRSGQSGLWPWPVGAGVIGLVLVGAWPGAVHLVGIHQPAPGPRLGSYVHRAQQAFSGLEPHLHVLWLALPVAVVGGLLLPRSRRLAGLGNDWWGWAGLMAGLLVIEGAYVTGTASVPVWLLTTAHRVTEFPDLMAWWIVAGWAVVGAAAVAQGLEVPSTLEVSTADKQAVTADA